ncbi:hypothetical protein DXG01_003782 [Tephrocybe rancida]|nr:hypothetical protein DXG01_003782 [Tephrocybe rancida]
MGTRIALQLSISYPDKALSLFLVSPLPVQEPKEVGEGRQEIYECWRLGWNDSKQPDLIVLKDSMLGGIELAFNSAVTPIIKALVKLTLPHAIVNFGPGRFEEFHTAAVDFFAEDVDYSKEKLSRIRCPIKLLYCGADIAYPLHYAEELLQRLVDAGVHAELTVVEDAPHFGTVTNFNEINPSLHDFIMQHTSSNVPLALGSATSPYEPILVATGWSPEPRSSDSSEEEELFDQLDYSIPTTTE